MFFVRYRGKRTKNITNAQICSSKPKIVLFIGSSETGYVFISYPCKNSIEIANKYWIWYSFMDHIQGQPILNVGGVFWTIILCRRPILNVQKSASDNIIGADKGRWHQINIIICIP